MLNINISNLYRVFRDFYTLTGTRIVLFNKDKQQLLEYPQTKNSFCNLIENDEYWKRKCSDCDRVNLDACSQSGKLLNYKCHLGLSEVIMPIYDNNGVFGYLMFGQVLLKENAEEAKRRLLQSFDEKNFEGITELIEKIPVKSSVELVACETILQAITSYILSNQWVTPRRSEFIRSLDKIIADHLSENISVEDICAKFHIKRTRLYSVTRKYLNCSIASYIRVQRIEHACYMLKNSDLTVGDIAFEVGFSDYGHFSRVFKSIKGISATEYRKGISPKNKPIV